MLGRTLIGIRVVAVVAVVAEMSVQLRYMESGPSVPTSEGPGSAGKSRERSKSIVPRC